MCCVEKYRHEKERMIKMLEVKNLTFKVNENGIERSIVKNISFCVEDGEMLVITGPNGGGKSTLAKVLMGIEEADAGQIILDGEDISSFDIDHRAGAGIGFAFQQPVRFKGVTVFDLLRLAAGKEISVAGACEYLSKVGLCAKDYIRREVNGSLSGGEIKRIEIATILARKTRVSVFDEPEAGIDLWSFQNLIQVFEEMHEQLHGSILIISHQERILNIADQIILIADGKLVKKGTKEEVLPELLGTANAAPSCDKAANRK